MKTAAATVGATLAQAMDQATYQGYVAGFQAARDQAAALAKAGGSPVLAHAIAAMAPLPDRTRAAPGQG